MRTFLIDFYCLPYKDLVLLFITLSYWFLRLDLRFGERRLWKWVLGASGVLWICVILLFTVSTREAGSTSSLFLVPFHSYREMEATGNIEILRSNFMNAVLFYPGGMLTAALLPRKWPLWVRILLTAVLYTGFSAGIEYYQYATASGCAEIDDVIHNGLGALTGAATAVFPVYITQKERG